MVIVQVILDDQPEKGQWEASCYLLKREDATDKEFALAQAMQEMYSEFINGFAKTLNVKVTTKEIKGK